MGRLYSGIPARFRTHCPEETVSRKHAGLFFSAMYFIFSAISTLLSYCVVYLRSLGFRGGEVGTMTAFGTAAAMLMLPISGLFSDKLRSPYRILLAVAVVLVPVNLLFPIVGKMYGARFLPFACLMVVYAISLYVFNSLEDAWVGSASDRFEIHFSAVRRFGSVGAVFISVLASVLIGTVFPVWSGSALSAFMGLLLIILLASRTGRVLAAPVRREKKEPIALRTLLRMVFRNYYFVTFLLAALAFYTYGAICVLDVSYLTDLIGVSRNTVGVITAFRASVEVLVMSLLIRVGRKPHWIWPAAAGLLMAAENLSYALVTGLAGMLAVNLGSALSDGIFFGLATNYILRIVDHRAVSTAVTVMGMTQMTIGIVGSAVGGRIIDRYGVLTLTTGAGLLSLICSALFVLACVLGRRVWKLPYVNE